MNLYDGTVFISRDRFKVQFGWKVFRLATVLLLCETSVRCMSTLFEDDCSGMLRHAS
jgi:hypothetical protein